MLRIIMEVWEIRNKEIHCKDDHHQHKQRIKKKSSCGSVAVVQHTRTSKTKQYIYICHNVVDKEIKKSPAFQI